MRLFLVWLALLAAVIAAPAVAQPTLPPRPAGPVYDAANIIPDADEQALAAKLQAYDNRTGKIVVVATVPSLEGDTVEDYAQALYKAWGIGGAQTDAGVLLLIAPSERKMRIEVGYGLEEYVTDILAGRIIRDDITPKFKAGDYTGGINAGVDALITQLDRTPADAKAVAEAAAAAAQQRPHAGGAAPLAGLVFWVVMIVFFGGLFGRRRTGRPYRGSGIGNVLMWSALGAAMNSGRSSGSGWGGGGFGGGGGGGFGGFGGGMSGGGGASGGW